MRYALLRKEEDSLSTIRAPRLKGINWPSTLRRMTFGAKVRISISKRLTARAT